MQCTFAGRATLDLVYLLDRYADEDTKVMAESFVAQAGGPALNAAITYAFFGGETPLISVVGDSEWSRRIKAELVKYRVILADLCADEAFVPPVSSVIVNRQRGTRTIINSPLTRPARFHSVPEAAGRMLLLDGFFTGELAGFARNFAAGGGIVCLDGGSWKPGMEQILPCVQIAILSERFRPPGVSGCQAVIRDLQCRGVGQVAITRGGRGIRGSDQGRDFRVPVEQVEAVDTLGAGDILHGAFCWFFLKTGNFEEALAEASRVATLSCRFFGARQWMEHCDRGASPTGVA